jgi:phage baseplate assembly protein V
MADEESRREARYGVYRAVVTDNDDPESRGRVKVRHGEEEAWAELATLMAGDGYGTWFQPQPDDEVLVAFEAGDARQPYVVGALWGKGDRPPETDENVKTIRTSCGATITIDDARCEVRIDAPTGIRLSAGTQVETTASKVVVNSGMAEFAGVVRCTTLIADSVVASSYTPGAGNVM